MSEIGRYCKAYPAKLLREYIDWNENLANLRKEQKLIDGNVLKTEDILTDDDVLYIQENYVVTDGIFLNENIIFDNVTEKWKKYCSSVLNFKTPSMEMLPIAEPPASEAYSLESKKARKPKRQKGENK